MVGDRAPTVAKSEGSPRHVGGRGVSPGLAARPLRGLCQVTSHLPALASCKMGVMTAPPSHSCCENSAKHCKQESSLC